MEILPCFGTPILIGYYYYYILQIWGELHFFHAWFGVWTNGSKLIVFARTDQQELTFSDVRDWEDPTLHQALFGLCMAGIDLAKRLLEPLRRLSGLERVNVALPIVREFMKPICTNKDNDWQ
jgi:hypothetical protein